MIALGDVRQALADAVERPGFTTFRYSAGINPPAIVVGFPSGDLISMDGAAEMQWPIIVAVGGSSEFNQQQLDEQCYGPGSIMDTLTGVSLLDNKVHVGGGTFDQHGLVELPENRGTFYAATLVFPVAVSPG